MKIIIHSIEELLQLTELIRPPQITSVTNNIDVKSSGVAGLVAADILRRAGKRDGVLCASASEPDGLPDDIDAPMAVVAQAEAEDAARTDAIAAEVEDQEFPERDADGAKYSTDWHSDPKKLTAKNVWRAKRGRDEAAYKWYLQEQAVEAAEAAIAAGDEPVGTETHALPQPDGDEPTDSRDVGADYAEAAAPAQAASTVDLQALVAASQEAAEDAADGLPTLLSTCRDFTSKHGTAEFNALKAVVAPRGDTGASLQDFTPAERRLMQACIANYPQPE